LRIIQFKSGRFLSLPLKRKKIPSSLIDIIPFTFFLYCFNLITKIERDDPTFFNPDGLWEGMSQLWEQVVDPTGILPKLYEADR
jgi:hypothetical protein